MSYKLLFGIEGFIAILGAETSTLLVDFRPIRFSCYPCSSVSVGRKENR